MLYSRQFFCIGGLIGHRMLNCQIIKYLSFAWPKTSKSNNSTSLRLDEFLDLNQETDATASICI